VEKGLGKRNPRLAISKFEKGNLSPQEKTRGTLSTGEKIQGNPRQAERMPEGVGGDARVTKASERCQEIQ